jgi:hypothetical protein
MRFQTRRLVLAVLLFNGLFWIWSWSDLLRQTSPYIDHAPSFEEVVPVYRFWTRAFPEELERDSLSLRLIHVIQQPSYFVVARTTNLFGRSWEQRRGPLSIGAWVLVITMFVSFIQWPVAGWLISRILCWTGIIRNTIAQPSA